MRGCEGEWKAIGMSTCGLYASAEGGAGGREVKECLDANAAGRLLCKMLHCSDPLLQTGRGAAPRLAMHPPPASATHTDA
jgi:hypothetical protein